MPAHLRTPVLAVALFAAVIAGAAGAARADDRRILAKDDIEYARALREEGYPDLADEIIKAVKRTQKDAGPEIELYEIDKNLSAAETEADPKKRKDLLIAALRDKEAFASKHKGNPAAERVADELPDLYRVVGEAIAAAVKVETDPAAAESLARQGRELFEKAEQTLVVRRDSAREESDGDEEKAGICAAAWFDLLRTRFFHAKLIPDESTRSRFLKDALKDMEDFELEFGDQLVYYQAEVYVGLIHKELGDVKTALGHLDTAVRLREEFGEKDAKGLWPMPEVIADVVSTAVLQKMKVQAGIPDPKAAAETAQDFLATTPSPLSTAQGFAILADQAEAYAAAGNGTAAEAAAKRLVAADPSGYWGAKGRTLLGSGRSTSTMSAVEVLRIAETFAAKKDWDKAAELCARAISESRGAGGNADVGADACLLLGAVWAQRGSLHEAVIAWEGGVQHFGGGANAPECLWRSINAWAALGGQEKRAEYTQKARAQMSMLAEKYPKNPHASEASLFDAIRLENDGKFAEAADAFLRVDKSSTAFPKAQYRAGNALQREVWRLDQAKNPAAAKALAPRAEELLKKARNDLEAAAGKTLDEAVKGELLGTAFQSRLGLANLYLCDAVGRAADVGPALEGAENAPGIDPVKAGAVVWELRFRALQKQGKLDEARKMLDGQLVRDPGSAALRPAALALARALDRDAGARREKEPSSQQALGDWRAAARYYDVWVGSYLRHEIAADVQDVESTASRLYVIGLALNGVPESVGTFTEWKGEIKEPGPLRSAAAVYESVAAEASSHTVLLLLARTQGFLGEWQQAAGAYQQVFDRVPIVDPATKRFDVNVIRARPELVQAWGERGVVERSAALAEKDNNRLQRAFDVFKTMAESVAPDSRLWWQGRYWQCRILFDKGDYSGADFAVRGLERNSEGFDGGKYGYQAQFEALKEELKGRVVGGAPKPK